MSVWLKRLGLELINISEGAKREIQLQTSLRPAHGLEHLSSRVVALLTLLTACPMNTVNSVCKFDCKVSSISEIRLGMAAAWPVRPTWQAASGPPAGRCRT